MPAAASCKVLFNRMQVQGGLTVREAPIFTLESEHAWARGYEKNLLAPRPDTTQMCAPWDE